MSIPLHVTRPQLAEALEPLCDLLGTSPRNFFDEPGLVIGGGKITFTVPVCHEDDPEGRVGSTHIRKDASGCPPHPQGLAVEPHVHGDDPEWSEWAYSVEIDVVP